MYGWVFGEEAEKEASLALCESELGGFKDQLQSFLAGEESEARFPLAKPEAKGGSYFVFGMELFASEVSLLSELRLEMYEEELPVLVIQDKVLTLLATRDQFPSLVEALTVKSLSPNAGEEKERGCRYRYIDRLNFPQWFDKYSIELIVSCHYGGS